MSVTGTMICCAGSPEPDDDVGGALRFRRGLDEVAARERAERLRVHGLRTPGEHHIQQFLPAALEA